MMHGHLNVKKAKKVSFLALTKKAYRRKRGTALLFLKLGTKWKRVINLTLRPPYALDITSVHIKL